MNKIHLQTALLKTAPVALREGGSVFVRIVGKSSNGNYTASFSGVTFSVKSQRNLTVGQTFVANVNIKDGKIFLVPKTSDTNFQPVSILQNLTDINDPQVIQYFSSLGIACNSISQKLFSLLLQMGLPIDSSKINRLRAIALKFPGKEEEAAEAALILEEKGIEASVESVKKFLMSLDMNLSEDESSSQKKPEAKEKGIEEEVKDFFGSIFNANFLADLSKKGLLTVFNQLNKKSNEENHWVVIPFDFAFEKNGKNQKGCGEIRFIADIKERKSKKIVLKFMIDSKNLDFVINLDKFNVYIKYCISSSYSERAGALLLEQIKSVFNDNGNVVFEKTSFDSLNGFCSENIPIPMMEVSV